jgi:hypothetical protein
VVAAAASFGPGSLRIDAPSPVSACILAEFLALYGARAVAADGVWSVMVDLRGAGPGTIPQALSRTRDWLVACDLLTASVSFDGHTHLLRRRDVLIDPVGGAHVGHD